MSSESSVSSESRLLGRVKWFNNKSGFGFITVCDEGEHKDKDIFIHYSSIRAESSQYKYLVQGEYVEFVLINTENGNHEFHASDVSGIREGPLMCETHRINNTMPSRVPLSRGPRRPRREDGNDTEHSQNQEQTERSVNISESVDTSDFQQVNSKRRRRTSGPSK
jgi:CspA family cold shock protein